MAAPGGPSSRSTPGRRRSQTPEEQALEEASRWLPGGEDEVQRFVEQAASVQLLAERGQLPDPRVTARSFDLLARIASAMPNLTDRKSVVQRLLRMLKPSIFASSETPLSDS
ncbi:unnamed protein product [Prorocentrum cordatum]|uniref:Uncharacterized protein n=1 Tax=Prorocentrum cordatum TaxID=2364126 RepID=A0ABN9XGA5_9DINO|nr:unnamed protein product [Polarella glacialis]